MKDLQSNTGYFTKGFALVNKSLLVYLINLLLWLPTIISNLLPNDSFKSILIFMSYILMFLSLGFSLSIPSFLLQKQENKSLELKSILYITLKNTKRIIVPIILLGVIFFVLLFFILLINISIFSLTYLPNDSFSEWLGSEDRSLIYQIFGIIISAASSFFVFMPILFSIKNEGVFKSLLKSFSLSIKNFSFLSLVVLVNIVSSLLTGFLPITQTWGYSLGMMINSYVGLLITSSALLYYQKAIKS